MRRLAVFGVWGLVGLWWVRQDMAGVERWTDEQRVWADAARLAPQKPRPWVNWGNLARLAGDGEAARRAYRQALQAASDTRRARGEQQAARALAWANLGLIAIDRQDLGMARRCLGDAARLIPRHEEIQAAWTWFQRQYPDAGNVGPASSCW